MSTLTRLRELVTAYTNSPDDPDDEEYRDQDFLSEGLSDILAEASEADVVRLIQAMIDEEERHGQKKKDG